MHQFPRPARSRLLALLATLAVVAAGCSGGKKSDDAAAKPARPATTTTTTAPTPAPLTGVFLADASIASRPALAIKVDNTPKGRPQSGIDKADVLIEEKVEGGFTRFIAVFHSEDADLVGPVRSVRSTDPGLVGAFGGVFAYAGGLPAFERLARQQPVTIVSEGTSSAGFQHPAGKQRPFSTYTTTAKLREMAKDRTQPPPSLFTFLPAGGTFAAAGATPATSATVNFGATRFTVDYDPTTRTWKRSSDGLAHATAGGSQLAFTNVIVQRTAYRSTGFRDPAGSTVDEATVIGEGDAVVLSQGLQVAVRWKKTSATTYATYTDSAGVAVQFPPGKTLVALPPSAAAITVK